MRWPFALYGNGMHDLVMQDLEVGLRVALAQDSEDCGWSALMDLSYAQWVLEDMRKNEKIFGSSDLF